MVENLRKQRKLITKEMALTAKRLLEQNMKNKDIQQILDISRSSTTRLIKNLVEKGDEYIQNMDKEKPFSLQRNQLRENYIKSTIENALNMDNSLTQHGIQEKLNEKNIFCHNHPYR